MEDATVIGGVWLLVTVTLVASWLPRPALLLVALLCPGAGRAADTFRVGVAQVDITPGYPVRLSGFGFRRTESEGVTQRLWAKALVLADEREGPLVLLTADNVGIPDALVQTVFERLQKQLRLKRERFVVTATHTHTAPMLANALPTLFGVPIPPEHQANIDRYTREFTDGLEQAALTAAHDLRPARLEWGTGRVGFATNRRTAGGPVDHDLPVLVVRGLEGRPRALWFSYACHCVTLSNNRVSGDWAGFAMEAIEHDFPGALALASIGCGADQNPNSGVTGDKVDLATAQGRQIADALKRLLAGPLKPVTAAPAGRRATFDLPLEPPRSRAEWEERAKHTDAIGYHARVNLARLDRGETLPTRVPYSVQSWLFGDQLGVVFLPGEVVVDYSLRLKRELDRSRLCVIAYANDAPCYIPSERVLQEGGYEGGDAMIYYDQPQQFAPGIEAKIVAAIHAQLPPALRVKPGTEVVPPRSPDRAP